jgi:hypothetical protein
LKDTKLEELRKELNKLVKPKEAVLCEGEILKVSQELDKLICNSYKRRQ